MIDLTLLLTPQYWFDLTPAPMSGLAAKISLVFFLAIILVGGFFRYWEKRRQGDRFQKRLWQRFSRLAFSMGGLGLLFYFFSFEQIRLFGARFWYLFWFLIVAVWLFFIWRDHYLVAPRERQIETRRHQREKYLPRKK